MTDVLAALAVLVDIDCPARATALEAFYRRWADDPLVIDKWFALQARSSLPGTIAAVRALTAHPAFSRANPNRVRALVGTFSQANPVQFHAASGEGYALLAEEVLTLDPANPTTAARLVQPLGQWRRYDAARQGLMRACSTASWRHRAQPQYLRDRGQEPRRSGLTSSPFGTDQLTQNRTIISATEQHFRRE